jgi:hypothetical protein
MHKNLPLSLGTWVIFLQWHLSINILGMNFMNFLGGIFSEFYGEIGDSLNYCQTMVENTESRAFTLFHSFTNDLMSSCYGQHCASW